MTGRGRDARLTAGETHDATKENAGQEKEAKSQQLMAKSCFRADLVIIAGFNIFLIIVMRRESM